MKVASKATSSSKRTGRGGTAADSKDPECDRVVKEQSESAQGTESSAQETANGNRRRNDGQAQAAGKAAILQLPLAVLGRIWPEERVVAGRRVCSMLHSELNGYVASVLLVRKAWVEVNTNEMTADFRNVAGRTVDLHWTGGEAEILGQAALCSGLTTLRQLRLKDCACGMESVYNVVERSKELSYLSLDNSKLDAKGTDQLMTAISPKTLTHLALCRNDLKDDGAAVLARALVGCEALTHLDLHKNKMTWVAAGALSAVVQRCTRLASLDLSQNEMAGNDEVGAQLQSMLQHGTALTHLNLGSTSVYRERFENVSRALRHCSALTHLGLERNQFYLPGTRHLVACLPALPALRHLSLRSCELYTRHVNDDFEEAGGMLETLSRTLGGMDTLTSLDLSENSLGLDGIARVASVANCTTLSQLNLAQNKLTPAAAKLVVAALPRTPAPLHLQLQNNELGSEGMAELAKAFKLTGPGGKHKGGMGRELALLHVGQNAVGVAGAKDLASVLGGSSRTLTDLDITDNDILARGAKSLAEGLSGCVALRAVVLKLNKLGPEGGSAVAKALAGSLGSMTSLDLRGCSVGNDGAASIATHVLPRTSVLDCLDLRDNGIGAPGGERLAGALDTCQGRRGLVRFDLRMNLMPVLICRRLAKHSAVLA